MIYNFPPELRLKSKADFKSLKGGKRFHSDSLCIVCRRNHLDHARLGLAISKKFGNAVQRNRLKRKIRETFRRHEIRSISVDLLIYPKADASPEKTDQMVASLEIAFHGIGQAGS